MDFKSPFYSETDLIPATIALPIPNNTKKVITGIRINKIIFKNLLISNVEMTNEIPVNKPPMNPPTI